ncbi:MAG: hypothetical protein ACON4O_05550 [Lentimonas sp.]
MHYLALKLTMSCFAEATIRPALSHTHPQDTVVRSELPNGALDERTLPKKGAPCGAPFCRHL